jgi:hypothetical protein
VALCHLGRLGDWAHLVSTLLLHHQSLIPVEVPVVVTEVRDGADQVLVQKFLIERGPECTGAGVRSM